MKKIFYLLAATLAVSNGLMASQPQTQTVSRYTKESETIVNRGMYSMGREDGYYGRPQCGSSEFYSRGYRNGRASAEEEEKRMSTFFWLTLGLAVVGGVVAAFAESHARSPNTKGTVSHP